MKAMLAAASSAAVAILALGFAPTALADEPVPALVTDAPVVLELFTSEGCNSCPPADALLGVLAKEHDLLPLAFHIDYWNYLGWQDPFSSKYATARQYAYGEALSVNAYTPQLVIDGARDAIGSDEAAVRSAIEAARPRPKLKLTVLRDATGALKVAIPAGDAPSAPASVYLALFDHSHVTAVGRGENTGETLTEFNIVRAWRKIGQWTGGATELALGLGPSANAFDAGAIILQDGDSGPVRGATAFQLPKSGGS